MRTCKVVLTAGLLALALSVQAQHSPFDRKIYPNDLREDLDLVRRTVEQSHPDPYRYHSKAEIDALFTVADSAFTGPMLAGQFIRAVLPALRAIGDAGTRLTPPADQEAAFLHTEPLIPLTVDVIGGRLYLEDELKGFRSLPPGCEILGINGQPAPKILAGLRASLVPEGADTTRLDRRIGPEFPVLYRRFTGRADIFKVDYLADGERGSAQINAMTMDEMRSSRPAKGLELNPWRMEKPPASGAVWLTLATFSRDKLKQAGISPEKFLVNAAETLRKEGISTLVIDVRGAGGADPFMAEQVFRLIAQAPFRAVRSASVRSADVPDAYRFAKPVPEFYASLESKFLPPSNGRRELRPDDPLLAMKDPQPKAFKGKVYVVCDGLTTGAGAAFVMLAKRTGRAKAVGEETGTNAASFCGGGTLEITLPHTLCVLHLPLVRYVPEGTPSGPADRGEMPDHAVPQQPWGPKYGKDTVRGALLNLIAEMQ